MVKYKALIAEDNLFNTDFLKAQLEALDVICDSAKNGLAALEMVKKGSYDIVFMDCQMPVMNGITAAAKIRELGGRYLQLPIIALTADCSIEDEKTYLKEGMSEVLRKPIELEDLGRILETCLHYMEPAETQPPKAEVLDLKENSLYFREAVEKLMRDMNFSYEAAYGFICEYVDTITELLLKMEMAYEQSDYLKITNLAHQMSGISCNLRLKEFQAAAKDIEIKSIHQELGVIEKIKHVKEMTALF
ncbi:MAG TPA: response regulator, partial [Lachnospiraceae bacterium]|nr:response regulator [Lachnospiraceae bacterium]